jgi:hypothetical protein
MQMLRLFVHVLAKMFHVTIGAHNVKLLAKGSKYCF